MFLAAKHYTPHMPDGGAIVSTASIGARRPRPNFAAYNASKGAVLTLTRGLATELAPRIRVNTVCPVSTPTGFDRAAMGTELPEEAAQAVASGIPMGRRATAEDVANAVLFLASAEASFLAGVCLSTAGAHPVAAQ